MIEIKREPAPRPQLRDARVEVRSDQAVVVIGGLSFDFAREDGRWVGGDAETIGRGFKVDEELIAAAREVAIQKLDQELDRRAGRRASPVDAIRCPECRCLLSSILISDLGSPERIECAIAHEAIYPDGKIVFDGQGGSVWEADRTEAS